MTELRSRARAGVVQRIQASLSEPVDVAWLAAFRVLFGLTLSVSMLRFIAYGWIDDFFVTPKFHFKYWLFEWVEPLSAGGMHALFWGLLVLALGVMLGVCFRFCATLFTLGFGYLQLLDVATYLNHYYLALLLSALLAISPAAHAYSLDARWQKRTRSSVPRAWLVLLRFQVGVVYVFAGFAKATGDWLLYAQPLHIWLAARTDLPLLGLVFAQPWAALLMSWAGFLFDSTIVGWLMWRRSRPYAYVLVIVFHALTRFLFPIGMFPLIMTLAALVYFPPDWPRRGLAYLGLASRAAPPPSARPGVHETRSLRPPGAAGRPPELVAYGWLGLLGLYCALQLLVPLRFLAYGDNVLWHEQGMRFSWRVMVREKNGSVTFRVRKKDTGHEWQMTARRWLTRHQEGEMAGQPDLILQFAHFLRDDFAARGLGPVEVRVDATVSLNGRPGAVLVDPEVDLATVRDGLLKARWIRSAPPGAPPSARPI